MTERLITPEAAAAYVAEHCPNPLDVTRLGSPEREYVCGCRECPIPDPTPEQFRRRVEEAIWQSSQCAIEEARGPYVPLSGRYLNAGHAHQVARMQGADIWVTTEWRRG